MEKNEGKANNCEIIFDIDSKSICHIEAFENSRKSSRMKKLNYFPFGSSQIYDVQTQFETENGRENGNINLQIQFYSEKQQIQTNDFLYA